MGVDFTGPNPNVEGIKKVVESLWTEGVTSFLPTIITNNSERIKFN